MIEGFHLLFHESGLPPLFHPLSASFSQNNHFFGVFQVAPTGPLWSEYAPRTTLQVGKKIHLAPHTFRGRVNFVISFVVLVLYLHYTLLGWWSVHCTQKQGRSRVRVNIRTSLLQSEKWGSANNFIFLESVFPRILKHFASILQSPKLHILDFRS